ncbi:MAG: TonB-dependent hemoglobin/transferrin/lactoferrin family receptor [Thiobacillaceae bacterium]|nr:TonB-dependent hemoglobin/transferrin/lactoferrin family receptor [Thiobacillaceae bacterium]
MRVLALTDGVRLSDYYNGGGPTNFTMSAPLPTPAEFLKRVEVVRGPASSLYGSDALGGVIGYLTVDVADVLPPGRSLGITPKLSFDKSNEGLTGTVLAAARGEGGWEGLLGYSYTHAHELDNQGADPITGPACSRPNPQDVKDRAWIAKLALTPAAAHRLKLTLEGRDQDTGVVVRRIPAALARVTAMDGDDHAQRLRVTLDWEHRSQGGLYDRLNAKLYRQSAKTRNNNRQTRTNTSATCAAATGSGSNCTIEQEFHFDQTLTGLNLQAEKGWGRHLVVAGVELSRTETEQLRDARVWRLSGPAPGPGQVPLGGPGVVPPTKVLAGDQFPLRDFAPGHTDNLGLFVQDAIELMDGRLTLTPGLRYDWRRLKPEPDALSQAVLAAIGRQAVTRENGAVSPKLAALYRLTPQWSLFGHVSRGFRAPNYEEVNGHFRNTTQSYGVAPNPDLKPETSWGGELGLRYGDERLAAQLAVYDNRYRDFIETVRLNCPGDPRCIAGLANTNMALNLSRVRIYGAEARVRWRFAPGWSLSGALAYAHGEDEKIDQPLNSVEPTRLSLALAREAEAWGGELRLRAAQKVKRVNDCTNIATCTGTPQYTPWFRPPGYEVVDLSLWWRPVKQARLALAVNNLLDRKYWLWSDIRQADARNPLGVDFYSQPGRSLTAALEYAF